jgi:hypothetical protein
MSDSVSLFHYNSEFIQILYSYNIFQHDDLLRTLFDYPLLVANKSFKRNVLIMMTRTIISLDFTIGYIFIVNLNLLVKVSHF